MKNTSLHFTLYLFFYLTCTFSFLPLFQYHSTLQVWKWYLLKFPNLCRISPVGRISGFWKYCNFSKITEVSSL